MFCNNCSWPRLLLLLRPHLVAHVFQHAHCLLPLACLAIHVHQRVVGHHVGPDAVLVHLLEHIQRQVTRVTLQQQTHTAQGFGATAFPTVAPAFSVGALLNI